MGNNICRYILTPRVEPSSVGKLAWYFRQRGGTPLVLRECDLVGRVVRKSLYRAIRNSGVRIVELEGDRKEWEWAEAANQILGVNQFLFRHGDDEGLDVVYPSRQWLEDQFPDRALDELLEPGEDIIPWRISTWYAIPSNPAAWDCTVPTMAALLGVALPGSSRPCPICGETYVSRGDRGQCPKCNFVAHPFRSRVEALQILNVNVAYGRGRCPRCHRNKSFTNVIEQCMACGQLLRGNEVRSKEALENNEVKVLDLIKIV